MSFYLDDILSQPTELKNALEFYKQDCVKQALKDIAKIKFREILWSGMGSSHFCSLPANIHLASSGFSSQVISTGELLHYECGRIKNDTLLCLISQSGESAEVVALLKRLPDSVFVIAVTNDPDSTLGKRGNIVFPLHVSNEKSVTTRTYLASVIITLLIAFSITDSKQKNSTDAFFDICIKMEEYLADFETDTKKLSEFSKGINCISVIGRGPALATVRAGALFFREVARIAAIDFDSAEFRHGPMEMVDSSFFSIVLAASGKTQELNLRLAESIAEKGGRVVLITDKESLLTSCHTNKNILQICLPAVEECFSPFLQIIPIQLLADALAKEKGISAGEFRWGSKITATE